MLKDDSDSEEEILVYAEFEDSVNIDKYRAIHILGADDKNPIIQLDETFFMGKYENALGTYMFFEQDPTIQGKDPLFDKYPDKGVRYVCKTRKLLSMEHAYVTPREGKEINPQNQVKQTEEDDVQPVMFRDIEQAREAFTAYFKLESTCQQNSSDTRIESANKQNSNDIRTQSTAEQSPSNARVDSTDKLNTGHIWIESTEEQNHVSTDSFDKQNSENITNIQDLDITRVKSTNKQNPDRTVLAREQNVEDTRTESTKEPSPTSSRAEDRALCKDRGEDTDGAK